MYRAQPAAKRQDHQTLRIVVREFQPKAVFGGLGNPLPSASRRQDTADDQRQVSIARGGAGKCAPRKRPGCWESRPGGSGTPGRKWDDLGRLSAAGLIVGVE